MHVKFLCLIAGLMVIGASKSYCQDKAIPKNLYIATNIPDSLKEDANAVVRYSYDEKIIKAPGKTSLKHHSLVTILNEKGDDNAEIGLSYDKKFNSIDDAQMLVYDATGKLIKKDYRRMII